MVNTVSPLYLWVSQMQIQPIVNIKYSGKKCYVVANVYCAVRTMMAVPVLNMYRLYFGHYSNA